MYLHHVISYLSSWERINHDNPVELNEILLAGSNLMSGRVQIEQDEERFVGSGRLWEKALFDLQWTINERIHYTTSGQRINVGSLGPSKNGIAAQYNLGSPSWFHRWLFSHGALAVRHAQIRIPVLVAPMRNMESDQHRPAQRLSHFEYLRDQLEPLAPLSVNFPFLILGVSDKPLMGDTQVIELASDPNITTERIVVDRCIEFPPEYHQAGLGILNFFGTFLRENYPDREAKVRIEQLGTSVRMTVETTDGNVEVVEKALRDYELVVSGKIKPEAITNNDMVIFGLRNELRIAQFRLDTQQDIIGMQNRRIDQLMDVLGTSLQASHSRPISIEVNPAFHNTTTIQLNNDISCALESIGDLLEALPATEEAHALLSDLNGSLTAIERESNPARLKESAGVTKLGRFLQRISEGNEALTNAISSVEKGQEIVGKLARSYNKIAGLCGLPSIPFV